MTFPIIAFCEGDMELFLSIAEAASYIEAVDVRAGHWIAFDASGKPLRIRVADSHGSRLGRLFCGPATQIEIHDWDDGFASDESAEKLAELIRDNLRCRLEAKGRYIDENWLSRASINELVVRTVQLSEF